MSLDHPPLLLLEVDGVDGHLALCDGLHVLGNHQARVRPEKGFKNRTRIPELPDHKSGSFYRNRKIFFCFSVPVNPEPEFLFLLPVPAKPEPEIRFYRISGRNLPEKIFSETSFFLKVLN